MRRMALTTTPRRHTAHYRQQLSEELMPLKWHDKKDVTVLSTYQDEPTTEIE